MFEEIKNINTSKKDLRNFGYTFGIIFIILYLAFFYFSNSLHQNLAIIALGFILLGFFAPIVLKPIYLIWMTFAVILGWFMTRVILSFLFYFVITPIGILTKIIGEDFLSLKKSELDSYWNHRTRSEELDQNYENQY